MALTQLFRVGTEFRFEVGSAILGMKGLQNQVERVSSAADNTLLSFQRLGVSAVANLGFGSASLIGVFTRAVQVSENFRDSQIKLSTVMQANRDKFVGPIDTFNERMLVSEKILKRVSAEARKFSLPEKPLKELTTLLGAQLAGKGLLGRDFENAIKLSRDFLKAAPLLGIEPTLATGQLQDLISGNAVKGRLFERLTAETQAFGQFQQGGTRAFNALPAQKRLQLLTKALQQFTSATDEVRARTFTLTAAMQRFKNTIVGVDGIIRPLGDAVVRPIVDLVNGVSASLDKSLRPALVNVGKIIKPLVMDTESFAASLIQLKRAIVDVKNASLTLGIIGIGTFLLKLAAFRKLLGFLGVGLGKVLGVIGIGLRPIVRFLFSFRTLFTLFRVGFFILRTFIVPLGVIFGIFQTISRAIALAKIRDIKALPEILNQFTALAERVRRALALITLPFREIVDFIAQRIAFLFQRSTLLKIVFPILDNMVTVLEGIGKVALLARAGLEGVFFALFQLVENLTSGKFFNAFDGVGEAFNAGIDSILEKNLQNLQGDKAPVVSQVTNINGGIKIVNEFRENLEPDRIAFSLKEQLMKTAQNPTQARGRNFSRAGAL